MYHCSVKKARGLAVFKDNGKALSGCGNKNASLNTRAGVYVACLSGRSRLSLGERSIVAHSHRRYNLTQRCACIMQTHNRYALCYCTYVS